MFHNSSQVDMRSLDNGPAILDIYSPTFSSSPSWLWPEGTSTFSRHEKAGLWRI